MTSGKKFVRAVCCLLVINLVLKLNFEHSTGVVNAMYGDLTFYKEWNHNFGSCGYSISRMNQNPFLVAALSRHHMGHPANPNDYYLCGRCLKINGSRGSIVVAVSDTCEGCSGDDVDVADTVFKYLEDPARGRVKVTWEWVDCNRSPPGPVRSEL